MKVSVVIPAHNEEARIAESLAALHDEAMRAAIETETIVVDNASSDHTAEIAKSFPGVRVVAEPRKGLARARQAGVDTAQGDVIAFLDADSKPLPGWFAVIADEMSDARAVCVSGPYYYYDLPFLWRGISWPYEVIFGSIAHFFTGQCIAGGNMAIKVEALRRVGGFNTDLLFYGEDLELGGRLKRVGRIIFTSRLKVASSARRFNADGVMKTTFLYMGNFLAQVFLKRPISDVHRDIR